MSSTEKTIALQKTKRNNNNNKKNKNGSNVLPEINVV